MSELMMNTIKDGRRHLDPKGPNEMQQRGPETVGKRLVKQPKLPVLIHPEVYQKKL